MRTLPWVLWRPVRPDTWTSSWYARSCARKSGWWSRLSALRMPTSPTFWKSNPLATICVPMSMLISPRWKDSTMVSNAFAEREVSRSRRAIW